MSKRTKKELILKGKVLCALWMSFVFMTVSAGCGTAKTETQENTVESSQEVVKDSSQEPEETKTKEPEETKTKEPEETKTKKPEEPKETKTKKQEEPKETKTKEPEEQTPEVPKSEEYYDQQFQGDCFIGDSRTQALFNTSQIATADFLCGIGLNISSVITTDSVMKPLETNKYRNIYIEFGVNELGWNSLDTFETCYTDFLNKVKELQPDANIYVQSIIPVTKSKSDSNDVYTLDNVEKFNKRVKKAAKAAGIPYLDITRGICGKSRVLPEAASTDGVHMGKTYNDKWLDYLISERKKQQ